MSYLKINMKDKEKALELFKQQGIDFDIFESPIDVFAEEEAEYRLSIIEENYCTIDNEEKREEILTEIYNILLDCEEYINSDYIENVAYNALEKILPDFLT